MNSAESLVNHISSGVEVLDVEGISRAGPHHQVHYTTDDPRIEFKLSGSAAASKLALLRLGSSARDAGPSKLYLDYGSGFSESNSLSLENGTEGDAVEVVLAAPGKLKSLRWDPIDRRSTGTVTLLTAQPLSAQDVAHRLQSALNGPTGPLAAILTAAAEDPLAIVAVSLSRAMSPPPLKGYAAWIALNEPSGAAATELWNKQLRQLKTRPLISIITPTYNTPLHLLRDMIDSVRVQVYPDWELCIADDASTDPALVEVLRQYERTDERIKIVIREENGHISAASNSALELATGQWTVLLDHDDLLRPNALLALVLEIDEFPEAQLVYSDEDKLDGAARSTPYFKPDYSPELLLAQNYFNHLTAHRTENIRAVGGWRLGFEGSQDYDLILRIIERIRPEQVRHIPQVLYHWRMVEGSTALSTGEKSYALNAGLRALQEHLDRTRPGSKVETLVDVPFYRVRPVPPTPAPLVSLIIPTRDKPEILRVAVESIIALSSYPSYEIIVVNNNSEELGTYKLFDELSTDSRIRIIDYSGRFNYPAINNYAARVARGTILGLVNNDIEIISPAWLEEMVGWAVQPGVGCVGAKLLYADMTVQHAGVAIGVGGVAGHGHKHARRSDPGYFGRLKVHSNVSAVTAACLITRRDVFEAVRGLDERLAVAFNDVDFCLRVRDAGYRNIFTPYAELIHHESKSRGTEDTPEKAKRFNDEVQFMLGSGPINRLSPLGAG